MRDKRISEKERYLDQVLHCVENIQQCQDWLRAGQAKEPLYTMVGILDWTTELQELLTRRRGYGEKDSIADAGIDECGDMGTDNETNQ